MDKQKTVTVAGRVEALAYGFIGVFFISLGSSYFQERFLYRVPRLLIPVFDLFGNVGLAAGMIILGGGFIYYGFAKWKSVNGKKALYGILAALGLLIGIALANIDLNPNKAAEIMQEMDEKREAQIDELRNAPAPSFSDPQINEHLAAFDTLFKRFQQSLQAHDEAAVTDCETALMDWMTQTATLMQSLSDDEKIELARYQGALAIRWNDERVKASE
jgi:hypothetical protein